MADNIRGRTINRLLALLLVVGVPTATIASLNEWIVKHPIVSISLIVLYEVGLLIVGFLAKVGKALESEWVDRAASWVDKSVRVYFSHYERHYLEQLGLRNRDFDVKGLTTRGSYTLELEQVFVNTSLTPKPLHHLSADPIHTVPPDAMTRSQHDAPRSLPKGRYEIWDYLSGRVGSTQHLAIIGAPGSGKTTLLKHITLTLLNPKQESRDRAISRRLPILLFLRDHVEAITKDPHIPLPEVIRMKLPQRLSLSEPPNWFDSRLASGQCLVMLDGLDEVADAQKRRIVVDWVEEQFANYPRSQFIVTSRPFGYRANPLDSATVLEVRPFTPEQVRDFAVNWYFATESRSTGKQDFGVKISADEGASDLLRRLRRSPALSALAVNPLLLTMIANVHYFRSTLPGRRVELYAEIFEVFLSKRQAARGLSSDLTPAQKQLVLQELAYQMMIHRQRNISAEEAKSLIAEALRRVDPRADPQSFLELVENTSGLLIEREAGIYSFTHLTFQEFLSAVHIRENGLIDDLIANVEDSWWHETIRLYAAQSNATPVIRACIESGSVVALTLGAECLEEGREVEPRARAALTAVLADESEGEDESRRRMLSEIRFNLRLRKMTPVTEGAYVMESPVSQLEYQLFLDDLNGSDGNYFQPDHWYGMHYPHGQGKEPILGMRLSDAERFCTWLNGEEHGYWTYRLPTFRELRDEQVAQVIPRKVGLVAVKDADRSYWVPTGGPSIRISNEQLTDLMQYDSLQCVTKATETYIRDQAVKDYPVVKIGWGEARRPYDSIGWKWLISELEGEWQGTLKRELRLEIPPALTASLVLSIFLAMRYEPAGYNAIAHTSVYPEVNVNVGAAVLRQAIQKIEGSNTQDLRGVVSMAKSISARLADVQRQGIMGLPYSSEWFRDRGIGIAETLWDLTKRITQGRRSANAPANYDLVRLTARVAALILSYTLGHAAAFTESAYRLEEGERAARGSTAVDYATDLSIDAIGIYVVLARLEFRIRGDLPPDGGIVLMKETSKDLEALNLSDGAHL
jgi:hypothetical protein